MSGFVGKINDGVNLRRKKSWIYGVINMFLFLGFLLFLTSKIYMKTEEKLFHTELNQPVKISSTGKITVLDMEYNLSKDFIIFVFKIEGEGDVGFKFAAQEKANPNGKLPVKEIYKEGNNYVVEVRELSKNFGAVALDVYYKNSEKESVNVRKFIEEPTVNVEENSNQQNVDRLLRTIYTDQRKVKYNDELLVNKKEEYELFFIDNEKKELKSKIKRIEEISKKEESNIKEVEKKIDELKAEMKYQTQSGITETQSKITNLESKVKESERNIKVFVDEKNSALDKMKKLEQKAKESK
ncbi:hypothetical protein CN445_29340 [Bacillus cereus]|nr:hypothetical protein CN445_29340 [Bacillus cereus]PFN78901.1 hypothetical protein COJ62_03320 [Bacillus cereus]